jgi:hypothetical protein
MGCTNSKVCDTILTTNCMIKLSSIAQDPNANKSVGIKEVYNLFIIVDFLPLKDLLKIS